jgi:septal ring factor EnvC (AmiA/AmiB activator)
MGRAIVVSAIIVLACYCFVLVQLASSRPRGSRAEAGPSPVLEARRDGSVSALNLDIQRLERRLAKEEERSGKLAADLTAVRDERADLEKQIADLESDLRRLRRQVNERPAAPAPPAANAPAANGPAPVPVPVPGPGPE